MKVAGIIAEYNPMHNGHIYHLEKTRQISKADFVVVVMSGDFTQRGMPAVMDKWTRSRIAVLSGVDLCVELPFAYATGSAETFARGGIGILEGMGVVDYVSFGSESGNIDELKVVSSFLKNEPPVFKERLKKYLDLGHSFPSARQKAVAECLGSRAGDLLSFPNNILAVEYLKNIRTLEPFTLRRESIYSSETLSCHNYSYASSKAVRKALKEGRSKEALSFVPPASADELIRMGSLADHADIMKRYYDILRARIIMSEPDDLADICGASEGIENRIIREIRNHDDLDGFAGALKSKRYTRSSIDRLLLHVMSDLRKTDKCDNYIRVLAFNENGRKILKAAQQSGSSQIITNINKSQELPNGIESDIRASDLYNLITGKNLYENCDNVKKPFYLRKTV